MTREEAIKTLKSKMDGHTDTSYEWAETVRMAISALSENKGDLISRAEVLKCREILRDDNGTGHQAVKTKYIRELPSVENKGEPETGHWSRKRKVDAYDIAGVKTWGIKCQCDRCCFTTIVVEDFGYYRYCPNCGARMKGGE